MDSHQYKKKKRHDPSGRYEKLTPNRALVDMNDVVDRIIDHKLEVKIGNQEASLEVPDDIVFNLFAPRFVFFFTGKAINKNGPRLVYQQANLERRYKCSMRDFMV